MLKRPSNQRRIWEEFVEEPSLYEKYLLRYGCRKIQGKHVYTYGYRL